MNPNELQHALESAMDIDCWVLPESLKELERTLMQTKENIELFLADGRRLTFELLTQGELPHEYQVTYPGKEPLDPDVPVIGIRLRTPRSSEEFPGTAFLQVRSKFFFPNVAENPKDNATHPSGVVTRTDTFGPRATVHSDIVRLTAGNVPHTEEAPFFTGTVNIEEGSIDINDLP